MKSIDSLMAKTHMAESSFECSALKVQSVRRVHSRAILTLSNRETYSMPRAMLKERPYRSGMPFDKTSFTRFICERSYPFAMEKAISLLALRARTEKELRDALRLSAYPEETIERVMAHIGQAGYINDADFSKSWAASRTGKGMGTRRIGMELRQKGVDRQTIEETLSSLDEDDLFEGAMRVARKAARGKELSSPENRQKVSASLIRRGYDYAMARRVIAQLCEEKNE